MRGKHGDCPAPKCHARITPAHAGKTPHPSRPVPSFSDHPRACGENRQRPAVHGARDGSPPRMRGKRYTDSRIKGVGRITPAHAGKTSISIFITGYPPDHPRACGENIYAVVIDDEATGSPPRMRGKPFAGGGGASEGRITPTHAGKTQCAANVWLQDADHPRACGENLALTLSPLSNPGSPPRMRGKRRSI